MSFMKGLRLCQTQLTLHWQPPSNTTQRVLPEEVLSHHPVFQATGSLPQAGAPVWRCAIVLQVSKAAVVQQHALHSVVPNYGSCEDAGEVSR